MAAGVLGAPVDLVSTVMRPFGYNVPSESVVGSSDWFGKLMGANRDSISYQAGQFGPVPDATDAMRLAAQIDPQMLSGLLSGMTAFHGSPHKFDKFDVSKIGTGEGVQAFGHGLYFAENPNVARDYQRTLARDDGGAFYEVDIPDDAIAKMIDWDDILSEQPKEIQELAALWGLQGKSGADVFGRDVVKEAARRSGGPRGASELFRNLGIPGIRYWDAGSRASEVGTRNFVVFDDSLVRILRRE